MRMQEILWVILAGGIVGLLAWRVYRQIPKTWLIEYGETITSDSLEPENRTRFLPDGIVLIFFSAILAISGRICLSSALDYVLFSLASFLMLLILIADWKTRIIPDPLSGALAVVALITAVVQVYLTGWSFALLGFKILAGIAAGAIFLLIGWIGSRIAHQDAMGMGDVKLIIPCVWLIDYRLTFSLVFLSFLTASLLAVPLLIKKYWPRDPGQEQPDGALAFGPFIVIATWIVWLLGPKFSSFWQFYLGQFQ